MLLELSLRPLIQHPPVGFEGDAAAQWPPQICKQHAEPTGVIHSGTLQQADVQTHQPLEPSPRGDAADVAQAIKI